MTSFFSLQNNIDLNDVKQVNLHGAAHGLDPNLSLEEIEKINAERAAKEQAEKEELEKFRNQLSSAGREGHHKYFRGLVDEENSN
jgi:hypothetical protein